MQIINRLCNFFLKGNARSLAIKRNIIGSLGVKCVSLVVGLWMVPLTLGYLSKEMYGIWLILASIITWMQLMDIGFTNGLKNKLAEALANDDIAKGKALVSTTYVMMAFIFVPLCVLLMTIFPFIDWSWCLNVDPKYNHDICITMNILVVCFCVQMFLNVLNAVLAAYQRVAVSSLLLVVGNCISLGFIILLTKYSTPSLQSLSMVVAVMPVLVLLVASWYFYTRQLKPVKPQLALFDRKYVKDLFGLGSQFFLIQIQMIVLFQCTNLLISNVSSAEDVTVYNISYKYISTIMLVFNIMLQPLWPAFTDAFTRHEYGWMKSVYSKMTRIFALCALAVIVMVIISPWIYDLWIGDDVSIPFTMTLVVAIYILVNTWDSLQVNIINGIGTIKLQTYVTLVGMICHIPLALFLSHFWGAKGVVLSMICIAVLYSCVFTIQLHKLLDQKAEGIWRA